MVIFLKSVLWLLSLLLFEYYKIEEIRKSFFTVLYIQWQIQMELINFKFQFKYRTFFYVHNFHLNLDFGFASLKDGWA